MTESLRKSGESNGSGIPRKRDQGTSFFAIIIAMIRHRKMVLTIIVGFVVLGLLKAILSPSRYTATALVVRESPSGSVNQGLRTRADLYGFDVTLGNEAGGVTPETYPEILSSREVLLAVAYSTFFFDELNQRMSLIEYYNRPPGLLQRVLDGLRRVTIGLPGTIIALFRTEPNNAPAYTESGQRIFSAVEQEEMTRLLVGSLGVDVDPNSGVMRILYTTTDPSLSAQITQSFIDQLQLRVQAIYTTNSEEKLNYFRNRLREADQELAEAEKILAKFIDSNWVPNTAKLQTELERLKRQVTFKTELYSHLQAQLAQVELELKRNQPVITILQTPYPPVMPTSSGSKRTLLLSLILGCFVGVFSVVVLFGFEKQLTDDVSRSEWDEIKEFVFQANLGRWLKRFRRSPRS